ncbi:lamin tail domain-containing protein, partial [Candidatus Sumerlaeota bacterium]|nr:lamin tail domain-containing protein [Candidatus Sumerlaeota bacterium]
MSAHRARAIGLIAVLLSAWLVLAGAATAQAAVVINEFMANNTKTKQDEDGQFDDWIELFNTSTANASVGGYYMSDQASQPRKWKIPAGTDMGGQQRLLIWADGTSPSLPTRPLHAAFRLNAENGELIALYDDKGTTIDVVRFGQQAPDISYGRITDGASRWVPLNKPNPLGANGTGGYIPPPSRLLGV